MKNLEKISSRFGATLVPTQSLFFENKSFVDSRLVSKITYFVGFASISNFVKNFKKISLRFGDTLVLTHCLCLEISLL